MPPEQVPGVNSGVNVVDPAQVSVPIQSKGVCRVSLYIKMKLCSLSNLIR